MEFVYRQFRRWTPAGLWHSILEVLNESNAVPDSVQMIDGTIIRAHHPAAGAKGGLRRKIFGRSKGCFTTKIHLRTYRNGLPMAVGPTPGEASDYKGYDSDAVGDDIAARGGTDVIPQEPSRTRSCRWFRLRATKNRRATFQQVQERTPCLHQVRQERRRRPPPCRNRLSPHLVQAFITITYGDGDPKKSKVIRNFRNNKQ